MPIDEGGRSNYSFSYMDNELVLIEVIRQTRHRAQHTRSLLKPGQTY